MARDSKGNFVPIEDMAQSFTYNGDGTVATITATDGVNSYVQTFTYAGGKVSNISAWVKQ